jgi:hypothetical protein
LTANEAFGRRGDGAALVPHAWICVGIFEVKKMFQAKMFWGWICVGMFEVNIPWSRMGSFCKRPELSVFPLKLENPLRGDLAPRFGKSRAQ